MIRELTDSLFAWLQDISSFFRSGIFLLIVQWIASIVYFMWARKKAQGSIAMDLRALAVQLLPAALCLLIYFILSPLLPLHPMIQQHMLGLICWIIAISGLYRLYCLSSDLDANPVVYIRLCIIPVLIGLCYLCSSQTAEAESGLQSFFRRVHFSWRTLTLNNSFQEVLDAAGPSWLEGRGGRAYIGFLTVFSPLLTATLALSFFTVPAFMLKLLVLRNRDVCIFSELNDRSIRYAEALLRTAGPGGGRRPLIAFCADREDKKAAAKSLSALNAVVLQRSIDHLHFIWLTSKKHLYFYLISGDESQKIQQAETLLSKYQRKCHIRCVTPGRINEAKIDEINCKYKSRTRLWLKTRKISISKKPEGPVRVQFRRFSRKIWNAGIESVEEVSRALLTEFYQQPLINEALLKKLPNSQSDDEKAVLRVLIVGGGRIGAELARICLWYCQLPALRVEVTVADIVPDDVLRSRILFNCPEPNSFEEDLERLFPNNPPAGIHTWGKTNFASNDLFVRLDQSPQPFHLVFVCTGNDDQNYRLTVQLRRYYLRKEEPWGCPDIRTVIWNDTVAALVHPDTHIPLGGSEDEHMNYNLTSDKTDRYNQQCRARIIGSMSDSIGNSEWLWFNALRYHAYYCQEKSVIPEKGRLSTTFSTRTLHEFCVDAERNRRSSLAVAVHGKCKEAWRKASASDEGEQDRLLAEAEHTRWCVYELLEGHRPVPPGHAWEYFNSKKQPKNRDIDGTRKVEEVRGYHVVMQPWKDLNDLAKGNANDHHTQKILGLAEKTKSDKNDYIQSQWKNAHQKWKDAYQQNLQLVQFAHTLEQWNQDFLNEGQNVPGPSAPAEPGKEEEKACKTP